MTGNNELAQASEAIDGLLTASNEYHDRVQQLRDDANLSESYRRDLMQQERATFDQRHREAHLAATEALDTAAASAAHHLSRPGDEAIETRKARAAMRVSRLIDAGTSALDAAQMFAENGDLDALRALRDDVPSWVTATLPPSERTNRARHIDATLLALDRLMVPLLKGDDATAVQVRLDVNEQRARLDAVNEYAFNPSPNRRIQLSYATAGQLRG